MHNKRSNSSYWLWLQRNHLVLILAPLVYVDVTTLAEMIPGSIRGTSLIDVSFPGPLEMGVTCRPLDSGGLWYGR